MLAADSEEFPEPWDPSPEPNLIQRWLTGWRLVLVLAVLALVYLQWRGGRDYGQFKAWRARGIATKAMAAAAAGDPAKAITLFDEAAILAPIDPTVMRRLADFCEPRQDINAIHALRQVIRSGEASPAIISDRTLYMIRPSSSWSARWKTPAGQPLHGFFFEWKPGDAPPKNMNDHQPSGCLGAVGIEFIKEFPSLFLPVSVAGTSLNARHLLFDDHGRPLHLLYLAAEAPDPDPTFTAADRLEYSYFDYSNRLRNVLQGRRNPGQRVIETGLWDEPSEAAARAIFTTYLQTWIKPGQAP